MSISTHKMLAERNQKNNARMAYKDSVTQSDKHFFKCTEGAVFTTVTDAIGGVVFDNTVETDLIMEAAGDSANAVRMGVDNNEAGINANNTASGNGWTQPGANEVVLTVMFKVVADPADSNVRGLMSFNFGNRNVLDAGANATDGRLLISRTEATFTARGDNGDDAIMSGELHTNIVFDDADWANWYYPPEGEIVIVTVAKRINVLDFYRNGKYVSTSSPIQERGTATNASWANWLPSEYNTHMTHTEASKRRIWAQSDANGDQIYCQLLGVVGSESNWLDLDLCHALGMERLRDGSNESFVGFWNTEQGHDSNCYRNVDGSNAAGEDLTRITDEYPQDFYGIHVSTYGNNAPSHDAITRMQKFYLTEWASNNKVISPELISYT